MENDEKEVDEKLYRVVRKRGCHVSTKVNPDGTKSALQFDENNDLMGPLNFIEVNESEFVLTEDVHNTSEYDSDPRTWKQVIFEDIVVPTGREAIERLLDIGFQHLDVWMEEKAVPAAKQKVKIAGKDVSILFFAMKSAIKGEQPKVLQINEEEKKKNNNSVQVVDTVDSKQNEKESREKVEITQAEFEQLVVLTKRSAVTLVGCINLLMNSAVSDMDGM